ncbi:MAG: hypothetical protein CML24_01750 [Rhizobiales bacterium]|nr:hypothetical protein [Hyphomicrobiales bacterium]
MGVLVDRKVLGQHLTMTKYRRWAVLGRLAAIVLSRPDPQPALVRESTLADRFGLSRATFRHYRDAVQIVRATFHPSDRHLVFTQSAVAANALARWWQHDPDGMWLFLHERRGSSDREILAAARQAKARSQGTRSNSGLEELIVRALNTGPSKPQFAVDAGSGLIDELGVRMVSGETQRFLGVSLELCGQSAVAHEQTGAIGLIEVPRLVTLERYRQEARSLWTRAVAASLVYPMLVLVFPGPAARRRFLSAVPAEARGAQLAYKSNIGDGGRKERCASRPLVFRPTPQTGMIMVSTRLGLAVDIFGREHRGNSFWRNP